MGFLYQLVRGTWVVIQIQVYELVIADDNDGIQNLYIGYSIIRNTMVSREEETNLLKRYDANCMAANHLR